jgi:nucleoside-diphosphate-sugar epimerase
MATRRCIVTGAGGFVGSHLVRYLKTKGYWVRGVDIKLPEFSETIADEFHVCDLRDINKCHRALSSDGQNFDEIYALAASMGGMGYIHSAEYEIMHDNVLINTNTLSTAVQNKISRYFFSSSVCIYRDMKHNEPEMTEEGAYPAQPDNEYGWEKLYAERFARTASRHFPMEVRIARFQNCYGPEGTWNGGREKAPAAICRKVAEAQNGGTIEIWGDGSAVRSYTYIDDMTDGIYRLMHSDITTPTNIGCPQYVSVKELVSTVAKIAGKKIQIKSINGPVGVQSRNFSNEKILTTGWKSQFDLKKGIALTYPWVKEQVDKARAKQQNIDEKIAKHIGNSGK